MEKFEVIAGPKTVGKKLSVFKLHKDDDVSWTDAKMKRENELQPWQIKLGSGRSAKRFKAVKEGGVAENASYFIFYKLKTSNANTYEVCPVNEWYNVSATQRYKTLTAEEAEQKFEQRHKTLNYFSVMHMKKNGDGEEGVSTNDSKNFKISEIDDWDRSGDDLSESDRDGDEEGRAAKKKIKKKLKKEKDDPDDAPDEGKEDSDEGDFEQREVDYMSDTSSESSRSSGGAKDETDVKGIAEEEALRELLSTDDEEDAEGSPLKVSNFKNSLGNANVQQDNGGEGSEDSSDSDDYDIDEDKMDSMFMKKGLPELVKQENQDQDTSPVTVGATKRKPDISTLSSSSSQPTSNPPKRHRPAEITSTSSSPPPNSHEKTVEDLLRKYLSRKPMTLRSLLKDIKSKLKRMGGMTAEMDNNLVNTIAVIINRIKPERQKINDTTYLSLKS